MAARTRVGGWILNFGLGNAEYLTISFMEVDSVGGPIVWRRY